MNHRRTIQIATTVVALSLVIGTALHLRPARQSVMPMPTLMSMPTGEQCVAASEASPVLPSAVVLANDPSFARFDAWADVQAAQSEPVADAVAVAQGVALASEREVALAQLIVADPEAAIAHAVPVRVREKLPTAVQDRLEKRVSAVGDFRVAIGTSMSGAVRVDRSAVIDGQTYVARVYGQRSTLPSRNGIAIHGIAVGNTLAVLDSPVRLLEPGERPDPRKPVANIANACPITGKGTSPQFIADAGNRVYYLCTGACVKALALHLTAGDGGTTTGGVVAASTDDWTHGQKRVLYTRVDFSDLAGQPVDAASAKSTIEGPVSAFFAANSYANTSLVADVTTVLRMPHTAAWYQATADPMDNGAGDWSQLMDDARAAATAAGYVATNYQYDIIAFANVFSGGFAGRGYVDYKGVWLNGYFTWDVIAHELGHNYGLWHANAWQTSDGSVIGSGTNTEYGDPFDVMGGLNGRTDASHFNAYEKNILDWVPTANVRTVTASGVYTISAHDTGAFNPALIYAINVVKDSDHTYWLDYRSRFPGSSSNGAGLRWNGRAASNFGAELLDLTPATSSNFNDASLTVGKSFTDPAIGATFTTLRLNAATAGKPASVDVQVTLAGDNATFVSQTIPTTVYAGQLFHAALVFQNNGNSPWTAGTYRLGAANPRDNLTWGTTRMLLPNDVAPGATVTIQADLHAPTTPGIYNFQWQMVHEAVAWFGAASTNVAITVGTAIGNGSGLRGTYFADATLDWWTEKLRRVDPVINFAWGSGSPDPSVPVDSFSVSWSGFVQPHFSETYDFITNSDDGVRVWVNGKLLIDNWTNHGPTVNIGSIALTAGSTPTIRVDYYEGGGGATMQLFWRSPHTAQDIIPASQLYPSRLDNGSGLRGTYYAASTLDWWQSKFTRVDPLLMFNWGAGSPDPSLPVDSFSASWNGFVVPRFSETYDFITNSDDGVRVWINGALVINNWTNHGPTVNVGSIALLSGQRYRIRVDYYEAGGGALLNLFWRSPTQNQELVPASQLFPSAQGTGSGLSGAYYANTSLTNPVALTRVDPLINFVWSGQPDTTLVGADNFSVSWTGLVQPRFSETYRFLTASVTGVRLWVNNTKIIDDWTAHAIKVDYADIALSEGVAVPIRMDFYNTTGYAQAMLFWSSPTQNQELLPTSQLYPPAAAISARETVTVPWAGWMPCESQVPCAVAAQR